MDKAFLRPLIMNKYQIEASNYLVDIIYEAIILESNNKKVNNE